MSNKERAVNLTWTWYLFLIANVLIIVGIAIAWGIYGKGADNTTAFIPVTICNVIAIILMVIFYYFDSKEIYLIRQHIPRKHFNLYFAAGFVFVFNLIFVFTFMSLIDPISKAFMQEIRINAAFGIVFGISALISLIAIGMYRYAKYKIDLALYLRRHGQSETEKKEEPKIEQATSGITDNADQK